MRAVTIRGFGAVTGYGTGVSALVDGLHARRDVSHPLSEFSAAAGTPPVCTVDRARFPLTLDGTLALVQAATNEALAMAGEHATALPDAALVCGGLNTQPLAEEMYRRHQHEWSGGQRQRVYDPGWLAQSLAQTLGVRGPVLTLSTACSSAANALLVARDLIGRGVVRRALVVSIESLSAIGLGGFHSLMMLAPNGCRPFDAARNGLQLGEGAGAIWLTADDTKNGFTLTGGANRCDTYHVTSSQPDGAGMAACMTAALRDANVAATAVRAIKAHGTGSLENDAAEAAAMRTLFGPQPPPFTGLKRYLGHTLGACGVVETIAFLGCLARGFVPASAGFADADPALALTPLTRHADAAPGDYLLNYFGFGGNFASLVVRRD